MPDLAVLVGVHESKDGGQARLALLRAQLTELIRHLLPQEGLNTKDY